MFGNTNRTHRLQINSPATFGAMKGQIGTISARDIHTHHQNLN